MEYRFTVTDTGKNRCRVQLEADGDTQRKKRHIIREFALLDSLLINDAEIEFDEREQLTINDEQLTMNN